jgi:hypothetical protein
MKPYQAIGKALLDATAITSIVSTRVYHGLRPEGTVTPSINYYELPGVRVRGVESQQYSLNCRAQNAGTARDLARRVVTLFAGADGGGTYGVVGTFGIARASLVQDQGVIPEPEDGIFNAPVDIRIAYSVTAVS